MPILLSCPRCGVALKAPDALLGRPSHCTRCRLPVTVEPGPPRNPASPLPDTVPEIHLSGETRC